MTFKDPQEHLREVLAKAKAAKAAKLAATQAPAEPAPVPAAPAPVTATAEPIVVPKPEPTPEAVIPQPIPTPVPPAPEPIVTPVIEKPIVEKPVVAAKKAPPAAPAPIIVPKVEPKIEPVTKTPVQPVGTLDFSHFKSPIQMVQTSAPPPKATPAPETTAAFSVPTYDPYLPPPASALDGFVFDDLPVEGQAVLEAITHVETTNNAEAESQVMEALEAVSQRFQSAVTPENPHDETLE
jgi:hypothetical protein